MIATNVRSNFRV